MHFTWPAWDKAQSRLALFVKFVLRSFVGFPREPLAQDKKCVFVWEIAGRKFRQITVWWVSGSRLLTLPVEGRDREQITVIWLVSPQPWWVWAAGSPLFADRSEEESALAVKQNLKRGDSHRARHVTHAAECMRPPTHGWTNACCVISMQPLSSCTPGNYTKR